MLEEPHFVCVIVDDAHLNVEADSAPQAMMHQYYYCGF